MAMIGLGVEQTSDQQINQLKPAPSVPSSCKPWEKLKLTQEMTDTSLPVVECKTTWDSIPMTPLNLFCDAVDKDRSNLCGGGGGGGFIPNVPTIVYNGLLLYLGYRFLFMRKG